MGITRKKFKFRVIHKNMTSLFHIIKNLYQFKICYFLVGFVMFFLIPSLIFMQVEGWTFLDAMYFCVISLTSVGFGDLVIENSPPIKYAKLE